MRTTGTGWTTRLGMAAMVGAVVVTTSCGGDQPPPTDPTVTSPPPITGSAVRGELAARAAAAIDLAGVRLYTLTSPDYPDREVLVIRATDGSWRVDLNGGALSGTVDVALVGIANERFHCTLAAPPQQTTCVNAAELTDETDPRVQHLFGDWLEVLRDRASPVSVAEATAPEGVGGRCFSVQPSAASLVPALDGGIYCFDSDGTLTGAQLPVGTLTLVSSDPVAPETVSLPGPVVEESPPPLVAPSPTATPTPAVDVSDVPPSG